MTKDSKAGFPGLFLRGQKWTLRKAVPKAYRAVESRTEIWLVLESRNAAAATREARRRWSTLLKNWEQLRLGAPNPIWGFQAAHARAQMAGLTYQSAGSVAKLPLEELLERIEMVVSPSLPGQVDMLAAQAYLGGATPANPTVSQALEVALNAGLQRHLGQSANQLYRWRTKRIAALQSFMAAFGDLQIEEIDHHLMFAYRAILVDRILASEIKAATGNLMISLFKATLREAGFILGFNVSWASARLKLETQRGEFRPPFSNAWISAQLLAPRALDGLDRECRGILLGMVNTGYRLSEGANLIAAHVRLDTDIPHIVIAPQDRHLKTRYSDRMIPLVGVSLDAFRHCPEGFPSWRDRPSLSARLNNFLTREHLRETTSHTITSLRHSFSDRLVDARIDERIRSDLMGHKYRGQSYGRGASPQLLSETVRRISFT